MPLGEGVGSTGRENKVLPTISQEGRVTGRPRVGCHGNTVYSETLYCIIHSYTVTVVGLDLSRVSLSLLTGTETQSVITTCLG